MPTDPAGGSSATLRLFFALWPETDVAQQLADLAAGQAERLGGRAMQRDTLHLTLAFLGNVSAERLADITAAASAVRGQPFDLMLDRLGFWHHNRLLWAGFTAPPGELAKIAEQLRQYLQAAGFPVDRSGVSFRPHVTLMRRLPTDHPPAEGGNIPGISWPCKEFVLAASSPGPQGPAYRLLERFPLD